MGYNPDFIPGFTVALPTLSQRLRATAFNGGEPIEHTYFSILFNQARNFAILAAHNIDGDSIIPVGTIPRRDQFRFDPDVPRQLQVDNDRGYSGGDDNPWDRGHLARRRALHWGEQSQAETADSESFFWTNIAPQHNRLHRTAWGDIEDWILDFTDTSDQRASVFTGPVFTPDDPLLQNKPNQEPIRIPAGFWKIFALKRNNELRAAAFLVWQRDFDHSEPVDFDPVLEQVRITTIEFLTGLSFDSLRQADPLRFGVEFSSAELRGIRAGSATSRATAITCMDDIVL